MAEVISKRSIVYDITFETSKAEKGAQDIGKAMDKTEKDINDATKAVVNFADKTLSAVARLRQIKNELNNFKGTEAQFQKLSLEAAKLTDQIQKTNQRIAVLASSTKNIQALASAFSGLTGVFTAIQGAQALFGKESENVQRALVKLQGSLALLQGVQAAVATVTEQSAAKTVFLSKAQQAYNIVVGTSTGALKLFKIALAATGVGLAIIGVTALAKAMGFFGDETEDASKKQKTLNTTLDEFNNLTAQAQMLAQKYGLTQKTVNDVLLAFQENATLSVFSIKTLEETVGSLENELKSFTEKDFALTVVGDTTTAADRFRDFTNKTVEQIRKLKAEITGRTAKGGMDKQALRFEVGEVEDTELELFAEKSIGLVGDLQAKLATLNEAIPTAKTVDELNQIRLAIALTEQALDKLLNPQLSQEGGAGDPVTDSFKARTEAINATAAAVAAYSGAVASSFGSLAGLAKEGSAMQVALAEVQILASYASSIASAIEGATKSGALTPAAIFTTPSFIATLVASTVGAFAASFSNLQKAKALSTGVGSNTATAFAEGEVDIHRSGETRGKDSIPAIIMPGESVITTDKTAKYKPFLEAIHNGNLEDLIRVNYVEPALAVKALEGNDSRSIPDYSEKLYRQILAVSEGNTDRKRSVRILASIDRKLTPKVKRHSH